MAAKPLLRIAVNASLLFMLFKSAILSQIAVHINSGNPVFPFPQFLDYNNPTQKLGNLATRNPAGVCHAEMEKSIREAYQIMMNRTGKTGVSLNGVDYLLFKSSPSCTEGDGYALLAAAAMADKTTFDGLWLWIHDNAMNKVTRYSTGQPAPAYNYSTLPGWQNTAGTNSASDGDADIALALLTASMQWGEFMGISDSKGNPISYKHDCIEVLKGLTDTLIHPASGNYLSGDIGLDGYLKNGDSWGEITDWASDRTRSGLPRLPEGKGPQQLYVDYSAPSYFHQFTDFLSKENASLYAWNIQQFRRCEASSDWLIGQLLANPKNIPFAGHVSLSSDNVATFTQFNEGEDFRLGWRTVLNYVWHGNPATTWDPASHQIKSGVSNSFEHDIGSRYGRFLWDNRQSPWNDSCVATPGASATSTYWGPSVLWTNWKVDGSGGNFFHLNWIHGAGSPSAVVSQDFKLMAEMYRQCEINWQAETPGDGYLTSVPRYYHGWFRLLGMLVLSGNYHAPSAIQPGANMKVYLDVDKTCATKNEEITYTISYRNYGSLTAENVLIVDTLPPDFSFITCTGGGVYQASSHAVIWNIGVVSGFTTATGIPPTTGTVSLKVALSNTSAKQYANRATIVCGNGTGWTSNEYPNRVSSVMKCNFVDALIQPLANSNSTGITSLHGGRPGIHFSLSEDNSKSSALHILTLRLFNDAEEPYINYGNYRVSYWLFDSSRTGIGGQNGWSVTNTIHEGIDKVSILHQNLVPGTDVHGKWNQRIIILFSDTLNTDRRDTNWSTMATITSYLEEYRGSPSGIHRGQSYPLRLQWYISPSNYIATRWDDDWSWDSSAAAADAAPGFPVTPDFTDPAPDNPGIAVTTLNPKHCENATKTIDNILVEEWDGYTWRKVFGSSPEAFTPAVPHEVLSKNHLTLVSFNRSAIEYVVPCLENVRIQILDMKGRVVATLVDSFQKPGAHSAKWARNNYCSNIYFLRIVTGKESVLKKFVSMN